MVTLLVKFISVAAYPVVNLQTVMFFMYFVGYVEQLWYWTLIWFSLAGKQLLKVTSSTRNILAVLFDL